MLNLMSDLRVYVKDKNGEERSFVVHYGTGCRLASAIDSETEDFRTLLKKAYRCDKGIYDIWSCMDCERNYRAEREFVKRHGLSYVAFRPKPCREPVDAGIIEIDFPSKTIGRIRAATTYTTGASGRLGATRARTSMSEGSGASTYRSDGP